MTTLTVDDLVAMSQADRFAIVQRALPIDERELEDTSWTGIDLSMPPWFHRLMWRTFRKTFHRDPVSGRLRGWNVRVAQTGWQTPPEPLRDRKGTARSFGHYELRSAAGVAFPAGWQGSHYLDYRVAGNRPWEFPANAGFCPLVRVNEGDHDLLLGWEIFRVAGVSVPLRDVWALRREGPLRTADLVPRPDGRTPPALDA